METPRTAQSFTILEKLGLNKNEAQIYEVLLNEGSLGVKPILSRTGLKRGNAYYHLDSLKAKGLVETEKDGGRTLFSAKHPEQLELLLAQQKAALSEAEENLHKTLPALRGIFQLSTTKPGVKFFEGQEGIIKIYETLLAQGQSIDSFEDKGEMVAFFADYVKEFISKRIKQRIFNRVIAPSTSPINVSSPKEFREARLLPVAQFPFRMDIKIVDNLVSLISFQKDNPVGILVENKEIAENFKMLFEMVWKLLEPRTGSRPILTNR